MSQRQSSEQQTLAVIFGGPSVEHTISVRSARAVIAAADRERWRAVPIAVTREARWLSPAESVKLLARIDAGASEEVGAEQTLSAIEAAPHVAACDAAFPLVHGAWGEDGVVQGFLETLGVPYVGAGVAASALAMNKAASKPILRAAGIPVAPSITVPLGGWREDPLGSQRAASELGYPLFVKPANGGSSIGISRVESREELADAFETAFECDQTALVEQGMVDAREIECGVLGGVRPSASVLGEIRTTRSFYDYAAKYEDPSTELIVPAELDPAIAERIREYSLAAFDAIGAHGMARADFLLGPDEQIWLGELNTIPGFTSVSMYPLLWEARGVPLRELISRLVELALERNEVSGAASGAAR